MEPETGRRSKALLVCVILLALLVLLGLGMVFAPQTPPAVSGTNPGATRQPEPIKTSPSPAVPPPMPRPAPQPPPKSEPPEPVTKDPPPVAVAKTATAQEIRWPVQLLAKTKYFINGDENRTMRVPLQIPAFPQADCEVAIGVSGATDDNGDRGMYFKLLDMNDKELLRNFSNCDNNTTVWFKVRVKPNEKYTLILEDLDTELRGQNPGNHFTAEVLLKP